MKKDSLFLTIGVIALVFILAVFIIGGSEGAEITIIVILGLISIFTIWLGNNNGIGTNWKIVGTGFLGLVITAGLVLWSDYNATSRKEKEWQTMKENRELMWAEKEKEDSIQRIEDSIQHHKDSIRIAEESKKLYEKEGDTILGKFLFGMSQKDFNLIKSTIERETNGIISISNYDFRIDDYKFHNDKLYFLTLKKTNSWTRYYYYDVHEYEEDNDGSGIVEEIIKSFSKRYGSPNNSFGVWHYNHKDIRVYAKSYYKSRKGLLRTEGWAVFIEFTDPVTEGILYKAKQEQEKIAEEARKKAEIKRKKAEETLQKKKEEFGGGL